MLHPALPGGVSMLGALHVLFGIPALFLGASGSLAEKGTRLHVRGGWAYAGSMVCLNVSSLAIYRLTGGFNTFHALAVLSLATVGVGVAQARWRGRDWQWRHYQYMSWSYVGLLAASCN